MPRPWHREHGGDSEQSAGRRGTQTVTARDEVGQFLEESGSFLLAAAEYRKRCAAVLKNSPCSSSGTTSSAARHRVPK